ncbi:hypothetical protein BKE38_24785 [Pseudoroseomonas deserti]|uniref:TauD/TfdA-like domain-containing protein n=1 Tax=Teichococcus deserti TaxID=1817963 RepID=A0A1V2GVK1_9PROT|nr:hypothetical protein [Pseudoroseomonas deserti]ONG46852.1 hypothetical protein BKE38_24785 [Pseudoroseomonas deserti]
MTDHTPPRRIAPQTGAHLWTGSALSPADWMLPLGAEEAAEIEAALAAPGEALPRLGPVLARLAERLSHGLGFSLLRGLPLPGDAAVLLGLLGSRIGQAVHAPPPAGPFHSEACDALLLLCREPVDVTLYSAAALHNELLKADRAALEVFYRALPQVDGGAELPVFAVTGGVFAARLDRASIDPAAAGGALAALDDILARPGIGLKVPLRAGDLLAVNPFTVWASCAPGLAALPLRVEPSRMAEGPFAALAPAG